MTQGTPERPDSTPPPLPAAPPTYTAVHPYPTAVPANGKRGRTLTVVVAVVVLLLAAAGVSWWALAGEEDDPIDHVEVSGGKLITSDSDAYEDCDDTDEYTYNDCDTDTDETYEFVYKITNKGDGPANYSVIVNAFDEDGDFLGQTYIGSAHLAAGKTDADKSQFSDYSELEDERELSDIASVKVAHVERVALAN